jgi:tRNA (guanine-N7-)-methyltransferase
MRLRNVKNKETIMEKSKFLIRDEENYRGKWNSVFKNNNPIEIEIGTGKGNFIIEKALTNPNINYIGIERYDSVIVSDEQLYSILSSKSKYIYETKSKYINELVNEEIYI